ncbi:transcriptional regulator [Syntrophotalea acetylenivorans]|uniref:Transcriptional regulator n=1 Tax=Syntrophotalea acetylenivorans TaxID=1842532 RepID=A0A1L3GMP5_9BACT|nr:P-II family nitrogen regulator [Syntrophotalea acetylenivorans]APG27165.1 transcriptional regulator [Syntrophotalea acetylenivorans]
MKEIKAYIKKHKLDEVSHALRKIEGLTGMSIIESCGFGVGWSGANRGEQIDCRPGVKVEIICQDDLVDEVIATIEKAARTGLKGDGKIYVGDIAQAVRISTGERGEGAV